MNKVYEPVPSDLYRSFIFKDDLDEELAWEDSHVTMLLDSFGKKLNAGLIPLDVITSPDDKKKKLADISLLGSNSLLILRTTVYECLKEKLLPCGQRVPLCSQSEALVGLHINRVLANAVVWAHSGYREQGTNRILYTPVLQQAAVEGQYLFMLQESKTRIYASQAFFDDCQTHGFTGIDWVHSKSIKTFATAC